jgi:hypothetical protein
MHQLCMEVIKYTFSVRQGTMVRKMNQCKLCRRDQRESQYDKVPQEQRPDRSPGQEAMGTPGKICLQIIHCFV